MKHHLFIVLAITIFLTSCDPGQPLGPTITPSPTKTVTMTSTVTPSPTNIPTATSTDTPTETKTSTPTKDLRGQSCNDIEAEIGSPLVDNIWKLSLSGWSFQEIRDLAPICGINYRKEFFHFFGPAVELSNDIKVTSVSVGNNYVEEKLNRKFIAIDSLDSRNVRVTYNSDKEILQIEFKESEYTLFSETGEFIFSGQGQITLFKISSLSN